MVTPTPEDEAALDATKAPLMEHLLELRKRLIYAVIGFGICRRAFCQVQRRDFLLSQRRPP